MTRIEQLEQILAEHGGMLQTAQVTVAGISKPVFYDFIRVKEMEQVAHGVYASADTWVDAMFLIHLRCGQAVFFHDTALSFHNLIDWESSPYSVTAFTAESGWNNRLYC